MEKHAMPLISPERVKGDIMHIHTSVAALTGTRKTRSTAEVSDWAERCQGITMHSHL